MLFLIRFCHSLIAMILHVVWSIFSFFRYIVAFTQNICGTDRLLRADLPLRKTTVHSITSFGCLLKTFLFSEY